MIYLVFMMRGYISYKTIARCDLHSYNHDFYVKLCIPDVSKMEKRK